MEPLIENVSDTAFWVAHFRAKESERKDAMFSDPLARKLVGERGRRIAEAMPAISRYAEWSVVSRTVIIDRFIERLVRQGVDRVVNLGAGLDTRPYRMELPDALLWIEADYPAILEHKARGLEGESARCHLKRVAVDLSDAEARKRFLASALEGATQALVITEGVIPYLSPEQVRELASDLGAQPQIAFWITEYFHPRVYRYLQGAVRTQGMKNAPFRFFPDDWFGFFKEAGWFERETRFSGEIAREFHRMSPMPTWAKLIFPFLPRKAKDESTRMTGYCILGPAHAMAEASYAGKEPQPR